MAVIFALYFIVCAIVTVGTWDQQAWYGWNIGPDGTSIISLTPGYPAAAAGLKIGDRVVWTSIPLAARADAFLQQFASVEPPVTLTVLSDGKSRTISMRGRKNPILFDLANDVAIVGASIVGGIAVMLVLLRPTRMTWGFLLTPIYAAIPPIFTTWGQQNVATFIGVNSFVAIALGLQAAGTFMFVTRFPGDRSRGALSLLDRIALPFGAIVTLLWLYLVAIVANPNPSPSLPFVLLITQYVIPIAITVTASLALLTTCVITKGSDRQRVIPVLALFVLFATGAVLNNLLNGTVSELSIATTVSLLDSIVEILLAIAIAHGVIKHRVIDVSFVISRTLVYTILTSVIVAAFVLIDFISSKLLERFQITILIEAVVALCLGIWLNTLHSRLDRLVDRTFFRRRHLAEARLQRVTKVLFHAEATAFVDETLAYEPVDALQLVSAAVFRSDDGRFRRVADVGWMTDCTNVIGPDAPIIAHLRAELEPVDVASVRWHDMRVPTGLGQPLLALPLAVRHELLGFVLYSGHRGGEALDPDEVRELYALVRAAAAAYDHLELEALRRRIVEAQIEIAQLRHGEEVVREMLRTLSGSAPMPGR